jgi:serine/threonine protein kinase/Tfp pilus assembly protein PilF
MTGPSLSWAEEATGTLSERLAQEMARRWQQGERPLTEDFLARHPELAQQPEAAVDLVYEELCLRQQYGPPTTGAELLGRFPQWRPQLEVLLQFHEVLEARLAGPTFPAAGESLGDFVLRTELGRGPRSRVFLATQPSLAGRHVVVKITPRDGGEHLSLARLQHSHIVPLYAVQDDPARNLRVLCLPFFGGTTLTRFLQGVAGRCPEKRSGRDVLAAIDRGQGGASAPLPARGAARNFLERAAYVQALCWIGACLADALQYAHEHGLVHLDVKPSNILLAADGQPMLLDFHLAGPPVRPAGPPPASLGGTPAYLSPEQQEALAAVRSGQPVPVLVDGRSDVYSLALVLYEALGGPVPLPPQGAPRLERCNRQVSVGLADIVHKAMMRRAADRYADAAGLAADLRRHLANQPLQGVSNRSLGERWRKWRQRRPHALRLANMFLAVLLAAAGVVGHLALTVGREVPTGLSQVSSPSTQAGAPAPDGDNQGALSLIEASPATSQDDRLRKHFQEGVSACRGGQFQEALAAFTTCLSLESKNARCFANRGLAFARLGQTERALADYDQALRLDPRLGPAALNRALLHLEAKHYDEAAADLQLALDHGAAPAPAHYALALVHRARRENDAAVASLRLALQYDPGHAAAGELLQRLQRLP